MSLPAPVSIWSFVPGGVLSIVNLSFPEPSVSVRSSMSLNVIHRLERGAVGALGDGAVGAHAEALDAELVERLAGDRRGVVVGRARLVGQRPDRERVVGAAVMRRVRQVVERGGVVAVVDPEDVRRGLLVDEQVRVRRRERVRARAVGLVRVARRRERALPEMVERGRPVAAAVVDDALDDPRLVLPRPEVISTVKLTRSCAPSGFKSMLVAVSSSTGAKLWNVIRNWLLFFETVIVKPSPGSASSACWTCSALAL